MSEDAALAALLVRNIGDIEAAINTAENILDKRLLDEIKQAAEISSNQAWEVKFDEGEVVRLTRQDWLAGEGEDIWLQFDELAGANGESDWTWIAEATASGPNGATFGLFLRQELITPPRFNRLLNNNSELTALLRKAGFERDASGKQLFIRITIDREALAQAFEKDDFDAALKPVQAAVKAASATVKNLDELGKLIRGNVIT
jgi:hypothetical protein